MQEHFAKLGYTIADPTFLPHISAKHGFYKLQKDGIFYFAKYSKDDTQRKSSIAVDIWWCNTVATLRHTYDLPFCTPAIVAHGHDWYIAEWIDGQPSVLPTGNANSLEPYIGSYATCLAALDAIDPKQLADVAPNRDQFTPYNQLDRRWDVWSEKPIAAGLLRAEDVTKARELIADYRQYVAPRLQHGEFVPWHMLTNNSTWWLIDGEHASTYMPRYYDLAYIYSRIFTLLHSRAQAAHVLHAFVQKAGVDAAALHSALLPVLTSRAIGMHFDAINDLAGNDYRTEAQDLLARCLSRDPTQIF
jgi:hypothetical protein